MDLEGDPLQAALATAFADTPIPQRHITSGRLSASSHSSAPLAAPPEMVAAMQGSDSSRKWRAESADTHQKAEKVQDRWTATRESQEAESAAPRRTETKEAEWETVERARRAQASQSGARELTEAVEARHSLPSRESSPRDVVSATSHRQGSDAPESSLFRPDPPDSESSQDGQTHRDSFTPAIASSSNPESRTWEEVPEAPSLDSSFPSLSFPERSASPSLEHRERPPPPPSVTLAIFDSSLSTRTRVLALASSLAINLFLPFINGVMLGFGEIFAKNVLSALGWDLPGMGIGIRTRQRKRY